MTSKTTPEPSTLDKLWGQYDRLVERHEGSYGHAREELAARRAIEAQARAESERTVARLKEALEWYANAPDLDPDIGLRARQALANLSTPAPWVSGLTVYCADNKASCYCVRDAGHDGDHACNCGGSWDVDGNVVAFPDWSFVGPSPLQREAADALEKERGK